MKLEIVLFTVCIIIWADAFRVVRETESSSSECCYPRPPRTDRGFKKHASRCCEFPVADLWQKFHEDLEKCKEERRKENEGSTSTTTTPAPAEKENETDNDFDADMPDSSVESEAPEVSSTTEVPSMPGPKGGHKGRGSGKGGRHRGGCGKCMRETMEKHGWSNNGTINWDGILTSTEKAVNPSADDWVPIVREAIANCSKMEMATPAAEPEKAKGHGRHHYPHHHHHHMTPEKRAWRCIINNSIMKCPNFPEDNEYCVTLREAHQHCLAMQPEHGPAQFKWCGQPRKHGKRH